VIDKAALMEEFRKARRQGHAIIDQELEDGLVAASVPLRDCNGVALAAVNVCGHASQLTLDDLERRCLPALRECVHRISRSLV
jgi:IclR family pca regulon transcriptional regulator